MTSRRALPGWVWLAGGAALLVIGGGAAATTDWGPSSSSNVNRDPSLLLPAMRRKTAVLLERMRARGYDAILWEGYRTPARAKQLAAKGVGISDSMHSYGAAADIVERTSLWDAPAAFWSALGQEAKALGLTWGGDWGDKPHVQLITVKEQNALRAMNDSQRQVAFAGLLLAA